MYRESCSPRATRSQIAAARRSRRLPRPFPGSRQRSPCDCSSRVGAILCRCVCRGQEPQRHLDLRAQPWSTAQLTEASVHCRLPGGRSTWRENAWRLARIRLARVRLDQIRPHYAVLAPPPVPRGHALSETARRRSLASWHHVGRCLRPAAVGCMVVLLRLSCRQRWNFRRRHAVTLYQPTPDPTDRAFASPPPIADTQGRSVPKW